MAPIVFNCPKCRVEIEAEQSCAGGTAQCPACEETILVPMPGIHPGMEIAGFKLERKLGTGGMGEVWLAHHKTMDRKAAIKILSPGLTHNPEFVKRFTQEVKTAAKLEHSNIVTAFDAGVENGVYYLASSFIDGVELGTKIKIDTKVSEREALLIVRGIANALKYAWDEHKLLHRDIKPANIILDKKGSPKLMDMGISKSLNEDASLTMTGIIVGTPYYMSPEQALSQKDIDFRADLYSLGATLYHMVTGYVPFDGGTAIGILARHITEALPPPNTITPGISDNCTALIEIMMAKNRDERHSSWDALIKDIDLVLEGKKPLLPRPNATSFVDKKNTARMERQLAESRAHAKKAPKAEFSKAAKSDGAEKKFQEFKPSLNVDDVASITRRIDAREIKAINKKEDETVKMRRALIAGMSGDEREARKLNLPKVMLISALIILVAVVGAIIAVQKLGQLNAELRQSEARRAVIKLEKRVEKLLEKGRYEEAAKIFTSYDGPYKDETRAEREAKAEQYLSLKNDGRTKNNAETSEKKTNGAHKE